MPEESIINPLPSSLLAPGTLWSKTQQQTQFARECGALKFIETEYQLIQQADISFVVRTLSNITLKEQAGKQQQQRESKIGKPVDPFSPCEPELFVGNLSETHFCLLNKFNVVDHHLLIVTRLFEEQTNLLNLQDFVALWSCLQEIDGLGFYNGGKTAGASQRHKHLQLIPLPLMPQVVHLPIAQAIADAQLHTSGGTINSFPFRHGIVALKIEPTASPTAAAAILLQQYHLLLKQVGFKLDGAIQQTLAYNFLATRNWMLIVPRSQESYQNIPINSLGFAGSLFVRDQNSLALLKQITPLKLLGQVAFPE